MPPIPFLRLFVGDDCLAILGAHESIAGGYYKAVEHARRVGADCVQLFTKNLRPVVIDAGGSGGNSRRLR
jgi:hypothetical protein